MEWGGGSLTFIMFYNVFINGIFCNKKTKNQYYEFQFLASDVFVLGGDLVCIKKVRLALCLLV